MADNQRYLQAQPFTLAGAGSAIGDGFLVLTSFKQIDGTTNITMTDFGNLGFGTIEPGSGTQEEQISFTGVTQNANGTATLTGVKTVAFNYPYTQTANLAKSHAGGTKFIISNTSGFYDELSSKQDDETIIGKWTFPAGGNANAPVSGTVYSAPTDSLEYASKQYVDNVAVAGAPDATTTVKGIVELATDAELQAGTDIGGTGAHLSAHGSNFTSTSTANKVPVSNGSGKLSDAWLNKGVANGIASLNGSTKVVEDPANATATPTASKIPIADGSGKLTAWVDKKFGGTGADGALDTSGGTVNIDLGSAAYVEKNYTSINVAANNLTFTNPNSAGTIVVLRSQGNVTISASIVASSLGSVGGTGGASTTLINTIGNNGTDATNSDDWDGLTTHQGLKGSGGGQAVGVAAGGAAGNGGAQALVRFYTTVSTKLYRRMFAVYPGSGGGGGASGGVGGGAGPYASGAGGNGGRGGAGVVIECGGALNFSGTITVAGANGSNGTNATAGSAGGGGGGAGGSGGHILVLYNTLTANTGTATVSGGNGGTGGNGFSAGGDNGGGGGGAGGGGSLNSSGGNGGAGGDSNSAGSSGATPSGGGTGGTGGSAAGGGDAGGGGGGGGGAAGASLITLNTWFF